ncbi:MAG: TetR/AcrR family transcriptional regulator [Betaproteobacteria bacterium]|nr:MAG: TetR/AcrR family transcriptional regulator [Betaproteobacteria bacterium]
MDSHRRLPKPRLHRDAMIKVPKPSKTPSDESSPASRQLILDVAAELFHTRGYAETGIRPIADSVGIKTASIYHHFSSKDQIYEEILKTGLELTARATRDAVARLPKNASPRDCIEAAIEGHLRGIHSHITYTSANVRFRGQIPPRVDEVMRPLREKYISYWQQLIENARRSGHLKPGLKSSLIRSLVIGALNQTLTWFDASAGSLDKLIETTIILLSGIWAKDRAIQHRRRATPSK